LNHLSFEALINADTMIHSDTMIRSVQAALHLCHSDPLFPVISSEVEKSRADGVKYQLDLGYRQG
jgi:hypothetical protein